MSDKTFRLSRAILVSFIFRVYASEKLFNTSIPNYLDYYRTIDYAVIGQQKSGTSTLWNILGTHPNIKWVGEVKENFWFNSEYPDSSRCDALLEGYLAQAAISRLEQNRTNLLIGDWSSTYFSCMCCPVVLKTINPNIKLVVVLRDPVQRALSRFLEQKRGYEMPLHLEVVNTTFAEYTTQRLNEIEACLQRASAYKRRYSRNLSGDSAETHRLNEMSPSSPGNSHGRSGGDSVVGWAAGLDLARWMEVQCYTRDNIYGWSTYDVFLENYLAHFQSQQILVLYTDDLAARPLETIQKVEKHIGASPFAYETQRISLVFNSRECYHWLCAKQHSEIRPLTEHNGVQPSASGEGPFKVAVARLRSFYKPSVKRLMKWTEQGRITSPPIAWQQHYG